ncbi:response regulator [Candidatus Woesearchaeota archaeon]|nr:response regulator [Candidatus Woesearchaeota archaeon]
MKPIFFSIILLLLILTPGIFAATASSENYSAIRFGNGITASETSSANFNAMAILIYSPGTKDAISGTTFTANIGFFDNTVDATILSIYSYAIYPKSAITGSIIRFYISALNANNVWGVLTLPSGALENISLVNNGNVYYVANPVGLYTLTFYANNTLGHIASLIDTFTITAVIPPVTPIDSGGGSSGGTTIKKCSYFWECTPWSLCLEGKQTRECKNTGTCVGIEGKPIEEMQCTEALFDVTLNLKNLVLTRNDTLKFNVELKETKGIEKIDVHVKYTIIDSENNKVFSQIETKAVMGNLSYDKEISEVKFKNGTYALRIDIIYGNLQRAYAEQDFSVEGEVLKEIPPKSGLFWIISLVLIILILLIILIILIKRIIRKLYLRKTIANKTIMIVDSELNIRNSVKYILEKNKCNVILATNSNECINKLKKDKIDLVLIDINLFDSSVKEFSIKIKTKFVLLNAEKISEAEREKLLEIKNIKGFVPKPFDIKTIPERVKKFLF